MKGLFGHGEAAGSRAQEPDAASHVSSWREDKRDKEKDVLLTLTVGLERIRRNSEREKGR